MSDLSCQWVLHVKLLFSTIKLFILREDRIIKLCTHMHCMLELVLVFCTALYCKCYLLVFSICYIILLQKLGSEIPLHE